MDDSPEANGVESGDSHGTASKKKKSKGMCLQLQHASTQCLCTYRSSVVIKSAVLLCIVPDVIFATVGKKKKVQTDPPTIPVAELLPGGVAPEGEWQSYKDEYVPCQA